MVLMTVLGGRHGGAATAAHWLRRRWLGRLRAAGRSFFSSASGAGVIMAITSNKCVSIELEAVVH